MEVIVATGAGPDKTLYALRRRIPAIWDGRIPIAAYRLFAWIGSSSLCSGCTSCWASCGSATPSPSIGSRATPIFHVVVPLIIVLGFIRGTFLGPIKSVDDLFGSAYGLTWLTALTVTILTYLFGLFVIVPALHRMDLAQVNPDGSPTPALAAATNQVKRLVSLELIGFLVIFTCMILMRFGL